MCGQPGGGVHAAPEHLQARHAGAGLGEAAEHLQDDVLVARVQQPVWGAEQESAARQTNE